MRSPVLVLLILMLLPASPALADPRDDRIDELQGQITKLGEKVRQLEDRLMHREVESRQELSRMHSELMVTRMRLEEAAEEMVARAKQHLRERTELLANLRETADLVRILEAGNAKLRATIDRMKPLLLSDLCGEDLERRKRAIALAVEAGWPEAVPALALELDADDFAERIRAAHALARLGRSDLVVPVAYLWVQDTRLPSGDRVAALGLLLAHLPQTELRELVPLIDDLGEKGRRPLSKRLVELGDGAAIPVLLGVAQGAEDELESAFGGPAPEGMSYEQLWELCRHERLETVRRNAAVYRKFGSLEVTMDLDDASALDVVDFLENLTGLTLECLPRSEDVPLTYACDGRRLGEALDGLLSSGELAYAVVDGVVLVGLPAEVEEEKARRPSGGLLPPWREDEPAWYGKLRERLGETISFEFRQTPALEVLDFLRAVTRLNLVPLPGIMTSDTLIDLQVRDLAVETALGLVCRQANLAMAVRWEAVGVGALSELDALGPVEAPPPQSAADRELLDRLRRVRMNIHFDETPLPAGLEYLHNYGEVKIMIDPAGAVEGRTVNLILREVNLLNALRWALRPQGLDLRVSGGVLRVRPYR